VRDARSRSGAARATPRLVAVLGPTMTGTFTGIHLTTGAVREILTEPMREIHEYEPTLGYRFLTELAMPASLPLRIGYGDSARSRGSSRTEPASRTRQAIPGRAGASRGWRTGRSPNPKGMTC
jgi:hypothetical protein